MSDKGFVLISRILSYCLSVEDFKKITGRDNNSEKYSDILCAKLDELDGVYNVDYDGHFGAQIEMSIEAEKDTSILRDQIHDMIFDYIKGVA